MNRENAPAESYPTFWSTAPQQPAAPVAASDAYAAFVSLVEADFAGAADTDED